MKECNYFELAIQCYQKAAKASFSGEEEFGRDALLWWERLLKQRGR